MVVAILSILPKPGNHVSTPKKIERPVKRELQYNRQRLSASSGDIGENRHSKRGHIGNPIGFDKSNCSDR